jgi:hypothetical protein
MITDVVMTYRPGVFTVRRVGVPADHIESVSHPRLENVMTDFTVFAKLPDADEMNPRGGSRANAS